MEQFSQITNQLAKNGRNQQLQNSTSSNALARTPPLDEMQQFEEAMFPIVEDSFQLSSQNATLEEIAARTKTWARALFGVIPEFRLQDAFDAAFQVHDSTFPVSAYEIKLEWQKIEIRERAETQARRIEFEKENPKLACPDRARHKNDDGDVEICSPVNWNEEILLPCKTCQPKAYEAERARFIAKSGQPEQKITDAMSGAKPKFVNLKNPMEILTRAKNELAAEMVKHLGTDRYDELHGFWLMLIRATAYVQGVEKVL